MAFLIILKFSLKGFLRGVLDTLKGFVAAIIAYLVRIPVAQLFNSWFMRDSVVGWVKRSIIENSQNEDSMIDFVELYENVPIFFNNVLSAFGLGDVSGLESADKLGEKELEEIAVDIGESLSMFLSTVLAVIVMFIVAMIVLSILIRLLDGLTKFSAIKVINRVLGVVLGVVCAIGTVWLITFILEILINITGGFGGKLTAADLDDSMMIGLVRKII